MAAKPVQVSIDEELLAQVDADAETRERGRSAFIRSAIERYLAAKSRREIDARLERAYGSRSDAALAEADDLIEMQSWPE